MAKKKKETTEPVVEKEVAPKTRTLSSKKKEEEVLGVSTHPTHEEKMAERKALGLLGGQQIVVCEDIILPNGLTGKKVVTAPGVTYHLSDKDFKAQHTLAK